MSEPGDQIRIRQAGPSDFPHVAEVHFPSWRESYRGVVPGEILDLFSIRQWIDNEYPQRLSRDGWSMRVAESGGRIVGMSISGPDQADPDHIEIDSLYVATDSLRHGVGSLLLADMLESQPAGDVVTWCAERNFRARRFYEKNGFRRDGRSFIWTLIPGTLEAPQIGFRLHRPRRAVRRESTELG